MKSPCFISHFFFFSLLELFSPIVLLLDLKNHHFVIFVICDPLIRKKITRFVLRYMLSSSTTNAIIQGHPGDPEWSKYSSCYPPMISTIFNELIVQIVSDFFPKPKAPPGVTMSITVHKPSPSFSFLPFSDFNYRAQSKHKFNRHFCSFLLFKPVFKQTQTQI